MPDDITRRRLLRASAASATGIGLVGTASGREADVSSDSMRQIPCLDLTDVEDRTRTISSTEPLPEHATGIQPGSQMFITFPDGTTAGCTANFIWRDTSTVVGGEEDGDDDGGGPSEEAVSNSPALEGDEEEEEEEGPHPLYIGAAGHCFLPTGKNAGANAQRENETDEDVYDLSRIESVEVCKDCNFGGITGLSVVDGETYELGEVVYARQNLPDGSEIGHDFGLVRIPEGLRKAVDPAMPQFGGPIDVQDGAVPQGDTIAQYGAGVGNGEVFPTMASRGVSLGDLGDASSWAAEIRSTPGDSGSPIVEYEAGDGTDAGGILTHLDFVPPSTAGTTATRCIEMPKEDGLDIDIEVVRETEDVTAD